jgi:hypothetical protein
VTEHPSDASLKEMLASFLRALQCYNDAIDKDPARAAAAFGEAIDTIVRERQLAMAMRSSLRKGYRPQDFFRR